jgi:hypothetical protein
MKPTILGNFFLVVGVTLLVMGVTAAPYHPHERQEKQMQLAFGGQPNARRAATMGQQEVADCFCWCSARAGPVEWSYTWLERYMAS